MTKILWDQVGERRFETGVDHGVLYVRDDSGAYPRGVAWNGLTTVTESPGGAESSKQYADNIEYLNLVSAESFGGTIEAFTYPDEFGHCDGTISPQPGIRIGQQSRKTFGLAYRTRVGNDVALTDYGYKLHVVYGALAAPAEKAYGTINDSPEAIAFSWEFSTSPVAISVLVDGKPLNPSSMLTFDSTMVDAAALANLEDILFGTVGDDARLPLPDEILGLFAGTVTEVSPTAPTFNDTTNTLTVPTVVGVEYRNAADNTVFAAGDTVLTETVEVRAYPTSGHVFPDLVDDEWLFTV